MSDPNNFTDRVNEMIKQATEAAGPAMDKARAVANDLAEKSQPMVAQVTQMAAQGLAAAADQLDKATGGKYSDKISSVSSKIGSSLDSMAGSAQSPGDGATDAADVAPAPSAFGAPGVEPIPSAAPVVPVPIVEPVATTAPGTDPLISKPLGTDPLDTDPLGTDATDAGLGDAVLPISEPLPGDAHDERP